MYFLKQLLLQQINQPEHVCWLVFTLNLSCKLYRILLRRKFRSRLYLSLLQLPSNFCEFEANPKFCNSCGQAIVVFVVTVRVYAYDKCEMVEMSMVALSGCIWLQAFLVLIETK